MSEAGERGPNGLPVELSDAHLPGLSPTRKDIREAESSELNPTVPEETEPAQLCPESYGVWNKHS